MDQLVQLSINRDEVGDYVVVRQSCTWCVGKRWKLKSIYHLSFSTIGVTINTKMQWSHIKLNLLIVILSTGIYIVYCHIWGKIRQVYPPKNFLSPISLEVREIIVLVNLF